MNYDARTDYEESCKLATRVLRARLLIVQAIAAKYECLLRELAEHCREALKLIERELCEGNTDQLQQIVEELRVTGDKAVRESRAFRCPF